MGLEDRNMEPDETAFIVDSEGKTCEIVGGRNVSFDDGYTYTLSQDGETVYQSGEKRASSTVNTPFIRLRKRSRLS